MTAHYNQTKLHHERVPAELRDQVQWLLWIAVPAEDGGKPRKVPVQFGGKRWYAASTTKPATWRDYASVARIYEQHAGATITVKIGGKEQRGSLQGIGVVLVAGSGIVGIDLDNVRDSTTGTLTSTAQQIVDSAATYAEISPSGTGVKLWIRGELAERAGNAGDLPDGGSFEMYSSGRYFTITTEQMPDTPSEIVPAQQVVDYLSARTARAQKRKAQQASAEQEPHAALARWCRERARARCSDLANAVQGTRHNTLLSVAGELLRYELSGWLPDAERLVRDAARACGLPDSEIEQVISDIRSQPDFQPWQWHGSVNSGAGVPRKWCKSSARVGEPAHEQPAGGGDGNQAEPPATEQRTTTARLLALAHQCRIIKAPDGTIYARLPDARATVVPVRGDAFADWLLWRHHEQHGVAPAEATIKRVQALVAARARHTTEPEPVHRRVAHHHGSVFVDLGDAAGNVCHITEHGWQLVPAASVPINFLRSEHQQAMVLPERGGSLSEFRNFVRVTDSDFVLLIGWLVAAYGAGALPVLGISGEHGSAKSTVCSMLQRLTDPSAASRRVLPREPRDLALAVSGSHACIFDNASRITPEISDLLCVASTGGVLATRRLYTNDTEQITHLRCAVILSGIGTLAERGDLIDRTLSVSLQRIPEHERVPEQEFWHRWQCAEPRLLGALFDLLAVALRDRHETAARLTSLPRMADAAIWIESALPALGYERGTFIRAQGDQQELQEQELLTEPLPAILQAWLGDGTAQAWRGSTSTLHGILHEYGKAQGKDTSRLPQSARALGKALARYAPALRRAGMQIEQYRGTGGVFGWWLSLYAEPEPVADTEPEPPTPDAEPVADTEPEPPTPDAEPVADTEPEPAQHEPPPAPPRNTGELVLSPRYQAMLNQVSDNLIARWYNALVLDEVSAAHDLVREAPEQAQGALDMLMRHPELRGLLKRYLRQRGILAPKQERRDAA